MIPMANDYNPTSSAPVSPQEPAIAIRNLRVAYGQREILHGVTFDVPAGETVVILGGSGSGKSTLVRTLVGLEAPTSAEIIVRGRNLQNLSPADWRERRQQSGISFRTGALSGSMP